MKTPALFVRRLDQCWHGIHADRFNTVRRLRAPTSLRHNLNPAPGAVRIEHRLDNGLVGDQLPAFDKAIARSMRSRLRVAMPALQDFRFVVVMHARTFLRERDQSQQGHGKP